MFRLDTVGNTIDDLGSVLGRVDMYADGRGLQNRDPTR
jgi:hypothetical protein